MQPFGHGRQKLMLILKLIQHITYGSLLGPCFIINLFLTHIPISEALILQSRDCRKDLTVSDNFDF